jgi:hypothetical protein
MPSPLHLCTFIDCYFLNDLYKIMITGTCDALDFGMVIAEDVIQGIDLPGGLT